MRRLSPGNSPLSHPPLSSNPSGSDTASLSAATSVQRRAPPVRARLGISDDVTLFGCFGGLSPDKRIPQVLDAFADTRRHATGIHLLLAGAAPSHYDPRADIERLGIRDAVTLTGYIEADDDLTAHIAACDVALTLRWPTAREISGPWLRCLAAGTPTVIVHLAHLVDVPALDPRTWQLHSGLESEIGDRKSEIEEPGPTRSWGAGLCRDRYPRRGSLVTAGDASARA